MSQILHIESEAHHKLQSDKNCNLILNQKHKINWNMIKTTYSDKLRYDISYIKSKAHNENVIQTETN